MSSSPPAIAPAPAASVRCRASVVHANGSVVVGDCELATTFRRRLRGLMWRGSLPVGTGLLLRPAGSVHTCFMRFPIDVVVLDRSMRVLRVVEGLRPWRATAARRGRSVLEMPAGEARRAGIATGDVLAVEQEDDWS